MAGMGVSNFVVKLAKERGVIGIVRDLQGIYDVLNMFDSLKTDSRGMFNNNKNYLRDNLIRVENKLVDIISMSVDDPDIKKSVTDSILDYSEKLFSIAKKDLFNKQFPDKSDNMFVNMFRGIKNNVDVAGKKKFWEDVFEKQEEVLSRLLDTGLDRATQARLTNTLLKYTNVVMDKFSKDFKSDKSNAKSNKAVRVARSRDRKSIDRKSIDNQPSLFEVRFKRQQQISKVYRNKNTRENRSKQEVAFN